MTRRRRFTPEQKAEIIRQNLIDKVEVSVLCEQHGLQPSVFYEWRNQLFANGASALQDRRRSDPQKRALEKEREANAALQEQLARKDQVIATLAERNVSLEKRVGEP